MISKHISYKEGTFSATAIRKCINNEPTSWQLCNMKLIANSIFEPLRNHFKVPIKINSFFRCNQLNGALGGSLTSQHMTGNAIDIDDAYSGITNKQMFYHIAINLDFDQLILENWNGRTASWVHVSYVNNISNRNKLSVMYKKNGYTKYKHFKTLEKLEIFINSF